MPIDLRIYENFHEAVARYKHFDLLMVNSLFDGMNLVAKEAPAVNTRDGVLMLSENTGAHEELGECALSVNPFDIEEQAEAIYRALTMGADERRERADDLRDIVDATRPGDWVDHQLADIEAKKAAEFARAGGVGTLSTRRAGHAGDRPRLASRRTTAGGPRHSALRSQGPNCVRPGGWF